MIILIILIFIFTLVPAHGSYVSKYTTGYSDAKTWYGSSTINWIQVNTSSNDVFLAAEPRRLAWLTNRTFVGMSTESDTFDVSSLTNLISDFNVTYVIIDTYLINYKLHSDFFNTLYSNVNNDVITPTSTSSSIIDINDIVASSNWTYSKSTYGLKLVHSYIADSKVTRIYQVQSLTMSIKVGFIDDSFTTGWIPKRGAMGNDGNCSIVYPLLSSDYAYIALSSTLKLDSSQYSFLSVKLRGNSTASKFWIAAIDTNDDWHQIQSDFSAPSKFNAYTYKLTNAINISNIYLGVSGTDRPSVEYDWVAIYGWQLQ